MPGFWDRAKFDPTVLKLKGDQRYISNALVLLCRQLELKVRVSELRGSGFKWFHENFPSFPVHMEAVKDKVDIVDFWTRPTKTEAWKSFFGLSEELKKPVLGVMLQVPRVGYGVLHTGWSLPAAPGYTRMERRSATSDKRGLILETVPGFVASVSSVWQP